MTPKQKKIASKAPPRNKIDGKDFAVLRAEKAKGRGKGLQDEKMKPGKVMKAMLGVMAVKKAADKVSKKSGTPKAMGLGIGMSAIKAKKMKEILGRNKGGKIMKADKGKMMKSDPTKAVNPMDKGMKKRLAERAARAARATKIGKIALGVAAVGLGAKEYLKKKMRDNEKKAKANKKMGGGMMKKPMMAKKGKAVMLIMKMKPKKKMGGGLTEATQRLKAQGKMGGGMMQRPMMAKMGRAVREAEGRERKKRKKRSPVIPTPRLQNKPKGLGGVGFTPGRMRRPIGQVSPRLAGPQMSMGGMMPGYKKGKSVMAKGCKLGRKKPTKMYT